MKNTNISALLLAAGTGSRLRPLTDNWPKCLMPIGQIPLLEHWLIALKKLNLKKTLVNLHYLAPIVQDFLARERFKGLVEWTFEEELLGTAGTIKKNKNFIGDNTLLLIHADNWSLCKLNEFINFHENLRPKHCPITMMTFETKSPETCGIVELNAENIVTRFHEKVLNPPGNKANAAIYLIEKEVIDWIDLHPEKKDFSTEVIPRFIGRIATWHNDNIHRDIGALKDLKLAQQDEQPLYNPWQEVDPWQKQFLQHPVHNFLITK
jgi:mannose-1-phosphate guanylyltransferase